MDLNNEDYLKIKDALKNEDDLKNEDNPKNEDILRNEVKTTLPEKIVDDSLAWQAQRNWPKTGNAILAGKRIPCDETNARGIGHAHMFRKDDFLDN